MSELDADALRTRIEGSPYHAWSGITLDSIEPGHVVLRMTLAEHHLNPQGVVHGGVVAGLLDSACGMSLRTLLPAGVQHQTIQLNVNYIYATASGELVGRGRAIHSGRRTGVSEAEVVDSSGRLVARGTATFLKLAG